MEIVTELAGEQKFKLTKGEKESHPLFEIQTEMQMQKKMRKKESKPVIVITSDSESAH
jgi:hypothetical protein